MTAIILSALLYAGLLCAIVAAVVLIQPVLWPVIIEFPWEDKNVKESQTVILAGSYNPPHRGHLAMLEYLSKRYGEVIAVVGFNPDKKYQVTPEERANLLRKMLKDAGAATNVRIEVVEGYIWRFAKREGASIFFRGIRSWESDGRDERALQILNTWGPILLGPVWPVPTMYLEGNPKYNHVSSTLIREICREGMPMEKNEALSDLVPTVVAREISELYCPKEKES